MSEVKTLALFRADIVEVSDDNAEWWEVPATQSITKSGGEGSQTQVRAINGVAQLGEAPGVPTWAVALSAFSPHVKGCQIPNEAAKKGTTIYYRMTTKEKRVVWAEEGSTSEAAVAIAVSGAMTFTGTKTPNFNKANLSILGLVVRSGGKAYVIDKIEAGGAVSTSNKPGSAVPAAVYSIEIPQLRESGSATVSAAGNYEGDDTNPISSGFTLVPDARNDLAIV